MVLVAMFTKIALILLVGLLGLAFQATLPPPSKICGSPNGPSVTSPRMRLGDGRYLAYMEKGVPKEEAKYKIIKAHGMGSSKELILIYPVPQELIEELGVYIVAFDRAGYGESDPNPKRSVKSEALDIQELADHLELGEKFYVLGTSMGGYAIYGCLKYIPHRLAGAVLVSPVVNYWWPSFPANLSREAYRKQLLPDQWTYRVAHYAPRLLYWWLTQKWFPSSSIVTLKPEVFSRTDKEIFTKMSRAGWPGQEKIVQQGDFESVHRDLMVGFGKWEFDPMDLNNPFLHNEGSVHLWQGSEDRMVPALLQRYVSEKLPWIKYHEVPHAGHMLSFTNGLCDALFRALLIGEEPTIV